ncbi:MAG: T9SS type A sorting domain-containing protein [Chitinophagaceae bacterium]|nr:T9SS type A sorting domain-containing protein [Chitinophagaceae bacterium]
MQQAQGQNAPLIQWQKGFGNANLNVIYSIQQTTDGQFIGAGHYVFGNYPDLDGDMLVTKMDSTGNTIWTSYPGGNEFEKANCVRELPTGNFLIAGETSSAFPGYHDNIDYWVVVLTDYGSMGWNKCYGGSNDDQATAIEETSDGGFIVVGNSHSNDGDVTGNHGADDIWVFKADATGNIQWQRSLGGTENEYATTVQHTNDGGYVVGGYTESDDGDVIGNHGDSDYWMVKLDESGNIQWSKCYGGSDEDEAHSIEQTLDGGFIIGGMSHSDDGDVDENSGTDYWDYWVVKTDGVGNIEWNKCYGGSGAEYLYSIHEMSNGHFIMAGYSNSINEEVTGNHGGFDYWIVQIDSTGNIEWQLSLGGSSSDQAFSITPTSDKSFIVSGGSGSDDGDVAGNNGQFDAWVVKLSCNMLKKFYADEDNDGYGNVDLSVMGPACFPPEGYVSDSTDCDDGDGNTTPNTPDWVNGMDNNCNTYIDEPFIEWSKCLGGNGDDQPYSIQQTSDYGYIVAGKSTSDNGDLTSNNGSYDFWIIRLDSEGGVIWQKSLGGDLADVANEIRETADGGFLVAGYARSSDGDVTGNHGSDDAWLVKFDASGTLEWQKCLGGTDSDYANSILQTPDGGYIIAGSTSSDNGDVSGSHGSSDIWLVKTDASGNILWQHCYGGTLEEIATAVKKTSDNGYIVAGYSNSNDGDLSSNAGGYDYWIIKTDEMGNVEWQRSFGGSNWDWAYDIHQTLDGGYVVGGTTLSHDGEVVGSNGSWDFWILKLDALGNLQWQKCLGGSSSDRLYELAQTQGGTYIVSGSTNSDNGDVSGNHGDSDFWIAGIDETGNLFWQQCFGGAENDEPWSVSLTDDGGFIVAGLTESIDGDVMGFHGQEDYWILKFSCVVTQKFYIDSDGDGHGTSSGSILMYSCFPPDGYAFDSTDCDDENAQIYPTSNEYCNGIDDNCNGNIDEGISLTFYADADNDDFGNANNPIDSCAQPSGYVTDSTDCDDTNTNIFPGADENSNNNIDDDCDGEIDEFGVGIAEVNSTSFFTVSPNPANYQTTIQFTILHSSRVSISIYDLSGRKINTFIDEELQQGDHSFQINTTEFSKGVYLVRMICDAEMKNQKLIIE